MIINHAYKFIFIKTQKTAGTSLEIALSSICGENDIITPISKNDERIREKLSIRGAQNYKLPLSSYTRKERFDRLVFGKTRAYYNHMSCKEIKDLVGGEIYDSYYKFCFERNPYDKAISLYYHQGGDERYKTIENFILQGGFDIVKGFDQYTIDKVVAVDDIFRFEDLNKSLEIISTKIGLTEVLKLPRTKAKSGFRVDKRPYQQVITEREKELIDIIWAREKALMKYTF